MNKLNNHIQRTIEKLSVALHILENKQEDPCLRECYDIINDAMCRLETEKGLWQIQHDCLQRYVEEEFERTQKRGVKKNNDKSNKKNKI